MNRFLIIDQRIKHALVDTHAQQRITIEVEGDSFTGAQRRGAEGGADNALVNRLLAQQRHVALVGRAECAHVDHRSAAVVALKDIAAGFEIFVADVQRAHHQSADIDAATLVEQYTVGIDQKDLPVGVQRPVDHAPFIAQHAVEGNRMGVRLLEVDRFAAADREALPVDRRFRRGLGNGGYCARLTDRRVAADDYAVRGCCKQR